MARRESGASYGDCRVTLLGRTGWSWLTSGRQLKRQNNSATKSLVRLLADGHGGKPLNYAAQLDNFSPLCAFSQEESKTEEEQGKEEREAASCRKPPRKAHYAPQTLLPQQLLSPQRRRRPAHHSVTVVIADRRSSCLLAALRTSLSKQLPTVRVLKARTGS